MAAAITLTVEADFDGDGVYEEDLTGRVSAVTSGIQVSRGIDRAGAYQISQLTLGLDNADGRYSPENTAGALYGTLEPGVKVRIKATHNAVTYTIWTGYVQRWESVGVQSGKVATAQLLARDILEYLRTHDGLNVTASTARDTDGALTAIFTALGIDASLYSLDDGQQDLALHVVPGKNALAAAIEVVQSEMGGYLWVNKSGVIRFESRASRVGGYPSPDATWGDGTSIVPFRAAYEYDNAELVTSVTVRPTIFLFNEDITEVMRFSRSMDNRPADSLTLAAGEIWESEIPYDSAVLTLNAPVASEDYLANAAIDGSGADKTSALTVTVTDLGGRVRVRLVNTDAGTIYVTEFRLLGTTANYAADRPLFTVAKSIPGQIAERSVNIDLPFGDSLAAEVPSYTMATLHTQRYPVYRVRLDFHPERNTTAAANLLNREIGDLVRYTDTGLGASGLYMNEWLYIDGISVDTSVGREVVMSFTLTPAYAYRALNVISYDLFTRADTASGLGTSLAGDIWVNSTNFKILSNKARGITAAYTTPPTLGLGASDCVVEASISNMAADANLIAGVVYRYFDASNYWLARLNKATAKVELYKYIAAGWTLKTDAAWTATDTAEIRVIAQGDRHRVWVDRKLVIDATDSALQSTGLSAGLFNQDATTTDFDDYYAQQV